MSRICDGLSEAGSDLVVHARCVPDDDDLDDPRGVRVEISSAMVGYLSRWAAWRYRTRFQGPTTCRARIRGGWDRGGGDVGRFGVRLDLDLGQEDGPLRPKLPLPVDAYSIEVLGESKCQDALKEIVNASPRRVRRSEDDDARFRVLAQLVREPENRAVRVEIDDRLVGYLSRPNARTYFAMPNAPEKVPAIITGGGHNRGERRRSYSVALHLQLP